VVGGDREAMGRCTALPLRSKIAGRLRKKERVDGNLPSEVR